MLPFFERLGFGNYEKVVYLAQTRNDDLERLARQAADRLGLVFEMRRTGYGDLPAFMSGTVET